MKRNAVLMGAVMLVAIWVGLSGFMSKRSVQGPPPEAGKFDRQVDSILALMTLEEKIGQMTLYTTDWGSTGPTIREGYEEDIRTGRCGALFNSHTAAFTRHLQEVAVKESRLGIPLIFGYDVIHGYKTIFPIPLAEACSWDMAAIERAAEVAAAEAAAAGLHWTFAPMVDISRDPRWGRVMEGAGEDPFLGSAVARARVRGFQGDGFKNADRVVACVKHFAGYGAPVAGRDYNTVDMSERYFRDFYLPTYKAAVEAGAMTVMTSFNDFDGIPATANKWLLTEVLQKEFGFNGFVVTDYTSINEMVNHGYAEDDAHAGTMAANAGVDMDMQGAVFQRFLKQAVETGKVSLARIDAAVRRILRVKYELGLFEDPYRYCNAQREKEVIYAPAHLESARDVARKSMVLLKNEKQVLPLRNTQSVALIGPLAADGAQQLGAWSGSGEGERCVSVLTAMEERAKRDGFMLVHSKGCEISGDDQSAFAAAVAAAQKADIIVAVVGEHRDMSGEAAARADISLPGQQEALLTALRQTGKPLVVVVMSGRPLTLTDVDAKADALLQAWFPGTMGGPAIADVLYGDYNPAGKLVMSFPRHVGQVPIFYNQKSTGRPFDPNSKWTSKYLDMPNTPLYPFGYGLSYTTFAYSDLRIDKSTFGMRDQVTATVTVRNTGQRAGEEVVQWYIRDLVGSTTRPEKELKGFEKIKLAPGESRTVSFKFTSGDLAFNTADKGFAAEPGKFWLMAGSNSADLLKQEIRLEE
jgi:beta-glucosidase